ncbi:MAG: hypothetical protein HC901_01170 [Bdellovibrionaceae bacterium]|nr:hypothetical protein [Pseudobdellovibrionaceae bacterium]
MSAHFIVTYRGQPVRFTYVSGRSVFEITDAARATSFLSEPDAWFAAANHQMRPDFVAVTSASALLAPEEQPA